jgi:hypothetical protein
MEVKARTVRWDVPGCAPRLRLQGRIRSWAGGGYRMAPGSAFPPLNLEDEWRY